MTDKFNIDKIKASLYLMGTSKI